MTRVLLLSARLAARLAVGLAAGLAAASCGPARPVADATAAEAPVDPAAAEKAAAKAKQDEHKAAFEAVKDDAAKISELADQKGNGFALYHRGLERLKASEYVLQQGGFEDLEAAADAGNADAQLWLGQRKAYGLEGYPLTPNTGRMLMEKAAGQDHVEAILTLGLFYEQDTFFHDLEKAKAWYERGVALGSQTAKDALAKLGTQEDF